MCRGRGAISTALIFTFQSIPLAGNYADTALNIKMKAVGSQYRAPSAHPDWLSVAMIECTVTVTHLCRTFVSKSATAGS